MTPIHPSDLNSTASVIHTFCVVEVGRERDNAPRNTWSSLSEGHRSQVLTIHFAYRSDPDVLTQRSALQLTRIMRSQTRVFIHSKNTWVDTVPGSGVTGDLRRLTVWWAWPGIKYVSMQISGLVKAGIGAVNSRVRGTTGDWTPAGHWEQRFVLWFFPPAPARLVPIDASLTRWTVRGVWEYKMWDTGATPFQPLLLHIYIYI